VDAMLFFVLSTVDSPEMLEIMTSS